MRKGRLRQPAAELAQRYGESVSFDWRLYRHDIAGSIAHATALARARIITADELHQIEDGLRAIEKEIESGKFEWDASLEDVHMNIEAALTKRFAPAGSKLHTARSRNDQIALDLRLYVKAEIAEVSARLRRLQIALLDVAERHIDALMPGYTHLQRAQPITFSHYLIGQMEAFERDANRLGDCLTRTDVLPLGSGALAGSTIVLDREGIAPDLGFLEFSDSFSTHSSLMPQKKNPDMAELTRGKTGRLYGNLMSILTTMKALPSSYNRDVQEDKRALFDSVDTIKSALDVFAAMLPELKINRERMNSSTRDPNLFATDLAEYLVKKGVPFREAHQIVGELVVRSVAKSVPLDQIGIAEMKRFSPHFENDVAKIFDVRSSLARRHAVGAPSPDNIATQIKRWRKL